MTPTSPPMPASDPDFSTWMQSIGSPLPTIEHDGKVITLSLVQMDVYGMASEPTFFCRGVDGDGSRYSVTLFALPGWSDRNPRALAVFNSGKQPSSDVLDDVAGAVDYSRPMSVLRDR